VKKNISKESKEAHVRVYARAHPELSKAAIYEHFKGTKYGARKTDVLSWVRIERKESISETKRAKAIPKKYRKAPEKPVRAESTVKRVRAPEVTRTNTLNQALGVNSSLSNAYSIAHVTTKTKQYHIKFTDESGFKAQFNKLMAHYQLNHKEIIVFFEGPYPYRGDYFATPEFEREMKKRGLW